MDGVSVVKELGLDELGWRDRRIGVNWEIWTDAWPFSYVYVSNNHGSFCLNTRTTRGDTVRMFFADLWDAVTWVEHLKEFPEMTTAGMHSTVERRVGSEYWEPDNYGGFTIYSDKHPFGRNQREIKAKLAQAERDVVELRELVG